MYNETALHNTTNILDHVIELNNMTAGAGLAHFILALIAIVSFLASKAYPTQTAFLVSMSLTSSSAIILFILGLIPPATLLLCIVLFFFSALFKAWAD